MKKTILILFLLSSLLFSCFRNDNEIKESSDVSQNKNVEQIKENKLENNIDNEKKWSWTMVEEQNNKNEEDLNLKWEISDSPRHQEWVEIDNNGKKIYTWVVYPQESQKATSVVLIHENKWLTDWARETADKLASKWYIVLAPDLLSSFSDDKKRTDNFETQDDATKALYTLSSESVMSDLWAVTKYAKSLDAWNWKIASVWFCWGWSKSYEFSTSKDNELNAAVVFYWTAPKEEDLYDNIKVPVYWFYGWNDERVNSTIEETEKYMTDRNLLYDYEIYDWAGHAFMRLWLDEEPLEANKEAMDKSWDRLIYILNSL